MIRKHITSRYRQFLMREKLIYFGAAVSFLGVVIILFSPDLLLMKFGTLVLGAGIINISMGFSLKSNKQRSRDVFLDEQIKIHNRKQRKLKKPDVTKGHIR